MSSPSPPPGRRWFAAPLLLAAVLAALPVLAAQWERRPQPPGPVEVVERFFAAIADRDVDRALSYVSTVPYGPEAALLHPDAIDDGWRLVAARPAPEAGDSYETWVEVTVDDGGTQATGFLEVTEADDGSGGWLLTDPLVDIDVRSVAPLTYLQVNDLIVPYAALYPAGAVGVPVGRYQLLPGRYRFFHQPPGLLTDAPPQWLLTPAVDRHPEPVPVAVPPLRIPEPTLAAVQLQVNALLDECVQFRVREPAGCPFAAGVEVGPTEPDTVRLLRDIRWQVIEYPTVEVSDPGGRDRELGLPIGLADPGRIRLTATGERDSGELATVSVDCHVSAGLDPMRVWFDQDGQPLVQQPLVAGVGLVSVFPAIVEDTCPPAAGGDR
ncbi:MAG TPA: hypothetical protein VIL37_08065 [Natronosporangium sp.]